MSGYLDYYRQENERHPTLAAAHCSFETARELIGLLAAKYGVLVNAVRFTSGNRHSSCDANSRTIWLNVDHLCVLTVIHEFAHLLAPGGPRRYARWHNAKHADAVDVLARVVVEMTPVANARVSERAARDLAKLAARQARAAHAVEPSVVRERKLEKRLAQITRLEAHIRRCDATRKALVTRLRRARRSYAALARAAKKLEATK